MAKEWILNMATNRWGLNKKRSVGPVSEWIREAMPRDEGEWEQAYRERLFVKVTEVVRAEIDEVTLADCIAYIRNLVIHRTFEGYQREIETVYGQL